MPFEGATQFANNFSDMRFGTMSFVRAAMKSSSVDELFLTNCTEGKEPRENVLIRVCRQVLGVHSQATRISVSAKSGGFPISAK